jgi:ribosome hibernation promoting factor
MNRKAKALEFVDAGYDIQVTGRNIEITEGMKAHAMDKLSKIERFTNRITDVNVIMDMQKKINNSVEIVLKAGAFKITSKACTTDMYVSIDQAVDKLEAQIRRYKSKIQDYHAKGHADLAMTVNVVSPLEIEEELEIEEGDENHELINRFKPHQVVKQESRPLKTLTVDEAIVKMELSGDPFMIFKNEADQKLKVIYRRKDENYGIIEPSC